jgi:hypothetical protein
MIADCGLRIADFDSEIAVKDESAELNNPQSAIRNP